MDDSGSGTRERRCTGSAVLVIYLIYACLGAALCAYRLAFRFRPYVLPWELYAGYPVSESLYAALVTLGVAWWICVMLRARVAQGSRWNMRSLWRALLGGVAGPLLLALLFWNASRIEDARWKDRVYLKNLCLLPYMYADVHGGRFPASFYQLAQPDDRGNPASLPLFVAIHSRREVTLESLRRGDFDYVYCGAGIVVPKASHVPHE